MPVGRTRAALLAITLGMAVSDVFGIRAGAAESPVALGTAAPFAVVAGTAITSAGTSTVSGSVGGVAGVTGFPPGIISNGSLHSADATASQAQADVAAAYGDANSRTCPSANNLSGQNLGGVTLIPGVYCFGSSAQLTGTLTLDAQGDPGAVFLIRTGSTLTTAVGSQVVLANQAQACKVFVQVGSSATIGVNTTLVGTVLALTAITVNAGASILGRLLARDAAVTLDTNAVTSPTCLPPDVLGITNPAAGNFAGRSVTGAAQTTNAALGAFSVSDLTATGAGWHVTAQATRFTGIGGRNLSLGSLSISAPTVASPTTTSPDPTVVLTPTVIDNGAAAPMASAALGAGMGVYDFSTTTLTLALPADVYADVYSSTVTISVVSGP